MTRRPRLAPALLGAAGVIQTIPSLALLALMVPLFAALGVLTERYFGIPLRAIGAGPALVALILYGVLPILRNTVAGLRGVDPAAREAARAVGMTPAQSLWRVELPLALPVIVAGLRTAAVWIVGTATLSTPVGATSLGNFIFSGLQTRRFAAVWLGCVAAAALALSIDGAIRLLERGLQPRQRALAWASLAVVAALVLGIGVARLRVAPSPAGVVTIGAKTFTEQYVLAEILSGWIERADGTRATTLPSLGSTVLFDALRNGEIDVYVDYTGTLWSSVMQRQRRAGIARGRARRRAPHARKPSTASSVAAALGFENTYALAMRDARATELGIATLSDLAPVSPELEIGADYEFLARPEWRALGERLRPRVRRGAQHGPVADVPGRRGRGGRRDQRVLDRRAHRRLRPARAARRSRR